MDEKPMSAPKLIIYFVLIAFTAFCGTVAVYLGAFDEVLIETSQLGPSKIVYKLHIGAYHKINDVIKDVEKWANENDIECETTFGEYLSDPEKISEEHLRSHAGCVVTSLPSQLPKNMSAREITQVNAVKATFSGSPAIGPFKVYPKVDEYLAENKLKPASSVFEFYRVNGRDMTTTYFFPLENQ